MSDSGASVGPTGLEASEGHEGVGSPAPVKFELNLEGPAAGSEVPPDADAPPAADTASGEDRPQKEAPTPPAAVSSSQLQEAIDRAAAAERRANEIAAAVTPYLQSLAQQQQAGARPKYNSLEQLSTDPNATIADVVQFVQHQQNQQLAGLMGQFEGVSRQTSSQSAARGIFSAGAVGQGNDYDSVRARYLEPVYRGNPVLPQLIHAAFPDDPARGEYLAALLMEMDQSAGGDVVKLVNHVRRSMRSYKQGARDLGKHIQSAAERSADRIFGANEGGRPRATRRVDAREMWDMGDAEFDALDRQLTGGY